MSEPKELILKPVFFKSFIIPVLLIIWKKFIEPYVWPIVYKWYYGVEYKKDEANKNGPFNCDGGKCIFASKSKPTITDATTETAEKVTTAGVSDKKSD